MKYTILAAGTLCLAFAACSSEDDLKWMPEYGYEKPTATPAAIGTILMEEDLLGKYAEKTIVDGTAYEGVDSILPGTSNGTLLLYGFMGRPEPLELKLSMADSTLTFISEEWYEGKTVLQSSDWDFAVARFDKHGEITVTSWNVYDISSADPVPLYSSTSSTLTKIW